MKSKQHTNLIWRALLALVFTLSALGSSAGLTMVAAAGSDEDEVVKQAVKFDQRADIYLGGSGVFFSPSAYTGTVEFSRLVATDTSKLHFTTRWTDVAVVDDKGVEFKTVRRLVYVYFNLSAEDRAAWDKGKLGLYYYDPAKKDWVEVTARLVKDKSAPDGRLAVIISKFGLYGLATKR